MSMNFQRLRSSLMTKALTLLGFSSPLALMACYGTPTTGYPDEVCIDANALSYQKGDSTTLSIATEGKWEVVSVPEFAIVSQDSGVGTAWITVKAAEDNLTDHCLEGEIVIRDENGEQSISIAQLPILAEEEVSEEEVSEEELVKEGIVDEEMIEDERPRR